MDISKLTDYRANMGRLLSSLLLGPFITRTSVGGFRRTGPSWKGRMEYRT